MPPKKKGPPQQQLSKAEKNHITNNYHAWVANKQAKKAHWASLPQLKHKAANDWWDELTRNPPGNVAPGNMPVGVQPQIGTPAGPPAVASAIPHALFTAGISSAPPVSSGPATSVAPSIAQPPPPTGPSTIGSGLNPIPAMSHLSLGTTPQATPVADVKDEIVEKVMVNSVTVTSKDLTAPTIKQELPTEMRSRLATLSELNYQLQYPLRQAYASTPNEVITNHFNVQIGTDTLHQYKILPVFSGKSKRKIRLIIETALEQCAVLRDQKTLFATDYFDTIVAWTNLHESISSSQHQLLSGDGQTAGSLWHLVTLQDGPATISLDLKYEGVVDVQSLIGHKNMEIEHANTDLQPTLRALNILVSKSFDEMPVETVRTGANKFFLKASHQDLTNGNDQNLRASNSLCILRGYSYTVKPGAGCILLNINAATSAFWRPTLLSTVFEDGFTFKEWDELYKALRGVRVYIIHDRGDPKDPETFARLNTDHARVKPIDGFGLPFNKQTFTVDGEDAPTNALKHFQTTYPKAKIAEEHRGHAAVNLGTRKEPRWYPTQYLGIVPYQKYKGLVPESVAGGMLAVACQKPPMAKALIGYEGIRAMGVTANSSKPALMPRCTALTLDPRMLRVPSSTVDFPSILYGGGHKEEAKSRWMIQNYQLLSRPRKTFNVLGISQGDPNQGLNKAFGQLQGFTGPPKGNFRNYDVATLRMSDSIKVDPNSYDDLTTAASAALARHSEIDFAMLFLESKSPSAYAHFKNLVDRQLGIHSVCITRRCIEGKIGEKVSNIVLKMNLKATGTNHSTTGGMIEKHLPDTLVLGADVTHPGTGAIPGTPSIAAIVGSVDKHAGRFLGSMRLQNQARKEIIDHVQLMVKERILDWVTEQIPPFKKKGRPTYGRLPTNIIYYRDGVSDPQFLDVQSQELSAIERAFRDAYDELKLNGTINSFELDECPKVNITALVCIKRHGTRFYPLSGQADGNGNCPPGTQVESVVTSPFFMDFYLQSHAAIKGTAKPCHYFVLRNDMQLSLTDLRMLTHELCYTYVRAPCGVSYASPAYYADRLCERGRIYLRDMYQRTDRGAALHTQFKKFKWDKEDAREAVRVGEFGNLRNDDGSARRKTDKEVKMEETHRKEVEELCDQWALGKARLEWYDDENEPVGQNPWHQNISKTMFWM